MSQTAASTTEVTRILDQLHRACEGPAWHGTALREILAGVTYQAAAKRPIPGAHTIWEIVLHVTVWMSVATARIHGADRRELTPEQDWPTPPAPSESAWREALERLAEAQQTLESTIRTLDDGRLSDEVEGDVRQSVYTLLHGVVQHNLYHGGQIALLKKAVA